MKVTLLENKPDISHNDYAYIVCASTGTLTESELQAMFGNADAVGQAQPTLRASDSFHVTVPVQMEVQEITRRLSSVGIKKFSYTKVKQETYTHQFDGV